MPNPPTQDEIVAAMRILERMDFESRFSFVAQALGVLCQQRKRTVMGIESTCRTTTHAGKVYVAVAISDAERDELRRWVIQSASKRPTDTDQPPA